jgi:hypothetical protein
MRRIAITLFACLLLMTARSVSAQDTTPEATAEPESMQYAIAWGELALPALGEIDDARDCAIDSQSEARYPEELALEELEGVFFPETACDWALLAAAYAARDDDEPAPGGIIAYVKAVRINPAFAYTDPLMFGYFGSVDLVAPPDFAAQPITAITLDYSFGGIGGRNVSYSLEITNADSDPVVSGTLNSGEAFSDETANEPISGAIDPELVQALGPALVNLVPAENLPQLIFCYDNYPNWTLDITFADGSAVTFLTNSSNFLNAGGPWGASIDGTIYVQQSADLLIAVIDIHNALDLPFGETAAMSCGPLGTPLLDLYFPIEGLD